MGALSSNRGFKRRPKATVSPHMNVTPLVDVVLVLLIIFMVLAPIVNSHFAARLPPDQKDAQLAAANPENQPLVLKVAEGGDLSANGVEIEAGKAEVRIRRMLNARPNRLLYLDGENEGPYGGLLRGMQYARNAGAKPIVMVTKEVVVRK